MLLGVTAAVIAGAGLARRSRRAARAGNPWPLRRVTHAAAEWIDVHLPGRSRSKPRLRPAYITALAVLVSFVAAAAARSAWNHSQQQRQLHAYQVADRTLATLALPSAIHRKPSSSCGSPICGYSLLTPPQLEPTLARLLNATPDAALADILPCAGRCPTELRAQVQGYPIVGLILWHMIVVRHGRAPRGAIPEPVGRGLFYLGSDIEIFAVDPTSTDN